MKRIGIFLFLLICVCEFTNAQNISAYIEDYDGDYTNVRFSPKGEVKARLYNKEAIDFLLTSPVNGWWKIVSCYNYQKDSDVRKVEKGYIHNSCIAVHAVNEGGQRWVLRSAPNAKSSSVYTIKPQEQFRPIDLSPNGQWIKVKTMNGKFTGWIEAVKVSGNLV